MRERDPHLSPLLSHILIPFPGFSVVILAVGPPLIGTLHFSRLTRFIAFNRVYPLPTCSCNRSDPGCSGPAHNEGIAVLHLLLVLVGVGEPGQFYIVHYIAVAMLACFIYVYH
ncbi:hypothetical protein GGR54DRAFT_622880 [Hypoxylon sp. NC1633]|nr:hypothetical protein GGR54DRAFT_622880 [Hypoxylon sp. NC1633]